MEKDKNKKVSLAKQLLVDILLNTGELYEMGMKTYRGPFAAPRGYYRDFTERDVYLKMKYLERQKNIKLLKEGEKQFFQLTSEGYKEALKTLIITKKEILPAGIFCLVIFDVPEDIRKVRWAFRNFLKKAGFRKVQKSVWESDREVVDELRALVRELKIDKYIVVYRADGER